ncbi:MAG TPA: hypothetical protein VIT91_02500 [Chthoniobacterales bacterium]
MEAGGRVEIEGVRVVALAIEEFHRHQRVEEIRDAARVQPELAAELRAGEPPVAERGEETKLDGGEQHLRAQKPKAVCRMASGETGGGFTSS